MTVGPGDPAPSCPLPVDGGGNLALSDLKGRVVVLYFYPKDNTPGCTREAIDFRDRKAAFDAVGAVVVGVSRDSIKSHKGFKKKQELNFVLLADEEASLCQAYEVWKEKKQYGRSFMGIERSTFLIDRQGVIRREWRKVKVEGHADEVLKAAREL
ncbi:MAG: peroxiredoxin [Magnetospirillum sp. WYHS-4]